MKFLVLGCNGMAGHLVSVYLKENGHEVMGFARAKSSLVDSFVGDVRDTQLLQEIIEHGKFDTVVNCVGILNQACEDNKADAVYINSFLPHQLVKLTKDSDTQVIHISTDCVFSGNRGQYTESDFKDGPTFYDRTKALGEIDNGKDLTLRQSIVGPDINPKGIGLLNWFLQQADSVNGYVGAMWTGQTTLQLAKTIEAAAKERIRGLYNMVPDVSISKFELLNLFNKYIRREKVEVVPVKKVTVDKSLKRTNWNFKYSIPSYEQMAFELSEWMRAHRFLYPHYEL